ncbi:MAG: flagellar hook-length control protein FliK, partial [Herminiimonas sp.]|nr:flagellar hook-length control protein FliK [Herminiimonas sp.]
SLTQAAGSAATDTLTPHVGTPAWDHALGQKVVWMAAGAEQSASLTLNPPDLGPIQIVINVSNSQADASFTAAQPEVRQALEAALPRLKEMLGDAGITLGQASVNAGNPNQNGPAQQHAGNGAGRGSGAAGTGPLDTEPVSRSVSQPISGGIGLVDTFA